MTYRPETRSRLRRRPVLLRRPPQRTPPRRPHRGAKRLLRRPHPRAHRQTRRVSHPLWSADRTEIPRSSQQLPARRVTEMPVHRRRHRHHPDPADDQGSRARRRRLAADLRRPDRAPMAFLDELAEYGHRVSIQPQGETGLLDLDRILKRPSRTPWCTAAAPSLCSRRSKGAAALGRRGPYTSPSRLSNKSKVVTFSSSSPSPKKPTSSEADWSATVRAC
jgi:hypothetical protein